MLRKLTVLRVNEKKLTRRYVTLLEQEKHLRRENSRLKEESSQMQVAVTQRLGYLTRYKVRDRKGLFNTNYSNTFLTRRALWGRCQISTADPPLWRSLRAFRVLGHSTHKPRTTLDDLVAV